MKQTSRRLLVSLLIAAVTLSGPAGCGLRRESLTFDSDLAFYEELNHGTDYSDAVIVEDNVMRVPEAPLTVENITQSPDRFVDITLQEAIRAAIEDSTIMQDLGAAVIDRPIGVTSIYDAAIVDTNPRFGPEAALSEFDAVCSTNVLIEKNDRALNNNFQAGGTNLFRQDLAIIESDIRKRTATGSEFTLRNRIDYDFNNAAANFIENGTWNWNVEAEVRQPILQGAGVDFNRIAGPNATPGVFNGVMVARLDTEASLAEFEIALRDLISNVENAYWELYFAYRMLDAKLRLRDQTLKLWHEAQGEANAATEAQFREQYFRYQAEVQNALTGRLLEPTENRNGSSGGTFRANGGVQVAERRLRLLMGMEITDGKLLRPIEEPSTAEVLFDWNEITAEAIYSRPELQRQRRFVKRRELELIASKNFLLPQLDTFGRYRWRGFGNALAGPYDPNNPFNNALQNLFSGDFQEWQLGMELVFPNGFRRAHAGVRNAQLLLARGRAILHQQERVIMLDLSNSYADMVRAYNLAQTQYNRMMAASRQKITLERTRKKDDRNQLMDAYRRVSEAEIDLHRALVEYVIAVKNVHFEKGSLLAYNEVFLAEDGGMCVEGPVADLLRRQKMHEMEDYRMDDPPQIPDGATQHVSYDEPVTAPMDEAEPVEHSSIAPASWSSVLPLLFSGRGEPPSSN